MLDFAYFRIKLCNVFMRREMHMTVLVYIGLDW